MESTFHQQYSQCNFINANSSIISNADVDANGVYNPSTAIHANAIRKKKVHSYPDFGDANIVIDANAISNPN